MKKSILKFLICILIVILVILNKFNRECFLFAESYSNLTYEFDLQKIPDNLFYKLSVDIEYLIDNQNVLKVFKVDENGLQIKYNNQLLDLSDIDSTYASSDTNVYFVKFDKVKYIFIDRLHFNDWKSYRIYRLSDDKIELSYSDSGKVEFVGAVKIKGYEYFGLIGYQRTEFTKKINKSGKLVLDEEYIVVGDELFPITMFYELVRDLEYDKYDFNLNVTKKTILKSGTKIRSLSTDGETYLTIQTYNGDIGKVYFSNVDDGVCYVNGHEFMSYYFLNGQKPNNEVYRVMPAY